MRAYALAALILISPVPAAAAAALYLSPAQATPTVGEPLTILLYADTGGQPADAAEAEIAYDTAMYAIRGISTDGSVLVTWATPPVAEAGVLRLSGWARTRFSSPEALIARFELVPLREGAGSLRIVSGTILMADEQETNVVSALRGASFAAQPRSSVPPPPPAPLATATPAVAAPSEAPASEPVRQETRPQEPSGGENGAPAQPALAASAHSGGSLWLVLLLILASIALLGAALGYLWHKAGR